ncbi:MAG TPA: hypothetical protein VG714_10655 [Acidobacteriaceae bacterium]|nr:hypothetical protein [Acidobacteriaceae bacterium]
MVRFSLYLLLGALLPAWTYATAQTDVQRLLHENSRDAVAVDSDADGLSDALEQRLLEQFLPTFLIARHDCADEPSEFRPGLAVPTAVQEDGTIYGQVFPAKGVGGDSPAEVEIHYYHLWRVDCGPRGHDLDTEHASVLVRATERDETKSSWRAMYWYAAAHEDTVCDVSQIARAKTLHAVDHGAKVWVSEGKHASYLNEELCRRGCGADRCEDVVPLHVARIVNLGETGHPMSGSVFISSRRWPLAVKMERSDFPGDAVARLEALPATDIAWFHPGRHPTQAVIAVSGTTGDAIALGGRDTNAALATAGDSTDTALSVAEDSTSNALGKSYRKTMHALGAASRGVGKALGATK